MSVELFDSKSGRSIGSVSDAQFQGLVDALEEESPTDRDYYISAEAIDMLEQDGADPAVVSLLRAAVGTREGADIQWRRQSGVRPADGRGTRARASWFTELGPDLPYPHGAAAWLHRQ